MPTPTIARLLESARNQRPDDETLAREAVELAAEWLKTATAGMHRDERKQSAQLSRMMGDAPGKALTFAMADQVFDLQPCYGLFVHGVIKKQIAVGAGALGMIHRRISMS